MIFEKMKRKQLMKKISVLFMLVFSTLPFLAYGQGSTYTGSYTPSSPLKFNGKNDIIIEGIEIKNATTSSILLEACNNVTIRNCRFASSPGYVAIDLVDCSNITITNCEFESVATGVYALGCRGNIKFMYNELKNANPNNLPNFGSIIYLNQCFGAGNEISYNIMENVPGQSNTIDCLSMYMSNGTADSPIKVTNNWIRGGGPDPSGGGIMCADYGGSYYLIENNILVDPGQYGIAVASGHHITVRNNKIYGKQQSFTNVGLYAWNQSGDECHDLTIENNKINYTNRDGQISTYWFDTNTLPILGAGPETNVYDPTVTASVLPTQIIGRARMNTVPTYVWNQTTSASFTVASNWTPARTTPTANDILQFSGGGSVIVTNMPTQTINQLQVLNNSTVELRSPASSILTASNLIINSGSTLKVGAGNQITVTTTLTNDGKLSLLSDNTKGTASILTPATLGGSGTYNIQQYLADGLNCHISSPVKAAAISAINTATSVTTYNEPTGKWVVASGSMISLKGYLAKLTIANGTIDFNGTIHNGNLSLPLTRTSGVTNAGFNMLGNPYPSYLNLNNLTNTDIESTIWYKSKDASSLFDVYNTRSGVYTSNSGLPVTGVVAPMQAFWVRVKKGKTASTLSLTNALRTHRDVTGNVFRAPSANYTQLQLIRLQVSNGTSSDETVIYSDGSASNGYDDYDSSKGMNSATSSVPDLYTTVDGENLAINGMNALPLDTEIPISFAANQSSSASFTLKATEINNLASGVSLIIKDMETGDETNLTDGSTVYTFTAATGTTKNLSLIFRTTSVTTGINTGNSTLVDEQATTIYKNSRNQISVNCNGGVASDATVSVFNTAGQKLAFQRIKSYHTVIETSLTSGEYDVTVNNGLKVKTKRISVN
ncbi:MAG: hypothetical protein H6Q19_326 [Bacteroidetes bacterium]|nr:hypothetical protein [Bacteroidota bacterium]